MSPIVRIFAAGAALAALATAGIAAAQDVTATPNYGTLNLASGFRPDPQVVDVRSGGSVDASALNNGAHVGNCTGGISRAPDVRLNYTRGQYQLMLSVDATADTTLVVNGPDGTWYCDDDSGNNGLNPLVRFATPMSGQYDIWIGTYGSNDTQPAQLYISEAGTR